MLRTRGADPLAVRQLRRPRRDQQLGRLALRLRRPGLALAEPAQEIALDNDVAAALRDLRSLDLDRERLVFRISAHHDQHDSAVLAVTGDELEELIGFVAAEANHEPNRRRQRRLDTAFEALTTARTATSW